MHEITLRTSARLEMLEVTAEIEHAVRAAGISEGRCLVFVPHTTAAVVVNENADPDVRRDLLAAYAAMVPDIAFAHTEGNSDAHFLSSLLGVSVVLPVTRGRLGLGTWQGVFLVELDGPRSRRLWISVR
jgi:secondary thiamine-phosphate synthase enzyme